MSAEIAGTQAALDGKSVTKAVVTDAAIGLVVGNATKIPSSIAVGAIKSEVKQNLVKGITEVVNKELEEQSHKVVERKNE